MNLVEKDIVFIISMPRSGSTLLQRILASHPQVASCSETWLLLPQIYAIREGCGFAEYSQTAASRAINDFVKCMPGGKMEYLSQIKGAFIRMLSSVTGDENIVFLEKTPRNNLILKEIVSMFPRSKYIFLWRNPAAIVASMIDSFSQGKWNIYRQEIDLFKGLENMLKADELAIQNRIDVRYEDLVMYPDVCIKKIVRYLGLENNFNAEEFVSTKFNGRMGDPTGVRKYSNISKDSLEKWPTTFCNPLRRRWVRNYIEYIGDANLSKIGYDKKEILEMISSINSIFDHSLRDVARMLYGVLDRELQISVIKRLRNVKKNERKYTLQ